MKATYWAFSAKTKDWIRVSSPYVNKDGFLYFDDPIRKGLTLRVSRGRWVLSKTKPNYNPIKQKDLWKL